MISTREAKRKIHTVRNIEQICRAMKTVASIRLRRAEQRLVAVRRHRRELAGMVERVARMSQEHSFLQARPVSRTAVALITSDRGLCGGYNANVVRRALLVGGAREVGVIALGRRGEMQMARRGYEIVARLVPLGGDPERQRVARLADQMGELYRSGEVDRVVVVYSEFLGGTRSELREETLLPVEVGESLGEDVICEPAVPGLLEGLMARHLRSALFGMALEGSASEHAARVAAMTAATDNTKEMIQELTLDYHKSRQAGITKELTEIVGASEATA